MQDEEDEGASTYYRLTQTHNILMNVYCSAMESPLANVVKTMDWYALLEAEKRPSSSNCLEGEPDHLFADIRCHYKAKWKNMY